MNTPQFSDLIAVIDRALNHSDHALSGFRSPLTVHSKADNSPVTLFDKEVEQRMRRVVCDAFPDHAIWGEEFGRNDPDNPHQWLIDPIDGTRSYILGNPLWGTLIGYVFDGRPHAGGVAVPALKERWMINADRQVTLNSSLVKGTSACEHSSLAVMVSTSPFMFDQPQTARVHRLAGVVKDYRFGGDCYNYLSLCAGWVDLVVEAGCSAFDIIPLIPLIEGCGGIISDWYGNPIMLDRDDHTQLTVLAAATPDLHQCALSYLGQ